MEELFLNKPGKKVIFLGNEAIVRGALEEGVNFVSTYPGTPASEIGNTFFRIAEKAGVYFEFSTNEKVALEAGVGASFSGLKTAVANLIKTGDSEERSRREAATIRQLAESEDARRETELAGPVLKDQQDPQKTANLAAAIEDAITDVLVEKTIAAAQIHHIDQIIVAGGVASNKILAKKLRQKISERRPRGLVHIPPPFLCTDNAVYIATAAFYNFSPINPLKLEANPNLSLSDHSQA